MTLLALRQNEGVSQREPERYLSYAEFAERIGVKRDTLNRYTLPTPDVLVGEIRGWKPETVDAWQAARPGRGRWKSSRGVAPGAEDVAP